LEKSQQKVQKFGDFDLKKMLGEQKDQINVALRDTSTVFTGFQKSQYQFDISQTSDKVQSVQVKMVPFVECLGRVFLGKNPSPLRLDFYTGDPLDAEVSLDDPLFSAP